ncbi:MAG: trypsin-like serine protease [Pseudomonadota bacterium]
MRFLLSIAVSLVLGVQATSAQDRLPQIMSTPGQLRPLSTLDAAGGWEAIGRVDTQVSFCSGSLIAADLVLTAAHCLYDDAGRRIEDTSISFAAGLSNDQVEAYRQVRRAFAHPDYPGPTESNNPQALALDVAILELESPIQAGDVRPLGYGPSVAARDRVTVVSYGRERERHPSIEEGCGILEDQGAILVMDCNVVSGSSGAPILRMSLGRAEIVGVMSAEATWRGDDVAIAVSVDDLLPQLLSLRSAGGGPTRSPGTVRRLVPGDNSRDGIAARFVRP